MTTYTITTEKNKGILVANEPYDTFNIIKNINGSAHYFFNGFEKIQGTNEIVIKLIRANEHLSEYVNVMYDGRRKNIKFTDKYEFIDFNKIQDHNIKLEIADAIKIKDRAAYDNFFNFPENRHGQVDIEAINSDLFNYKNAAKELDRYLAKLIQYYKKTPAILDLTAFSGSALLGDSSISIGHNSNIASSDYNLMTIRDTGNSSIVSNPYYMSGNGTTESRITENDNVIIVSRNRKKQNNKIILSPAKLIIL